jgi:nicotinamidase/pyrazinamidase
MLKALILVDIQNDFMPDGALPVKGGDKIVPIVNTLMKSFGLVVATQDWHPKDHGSFASNQPGSVVGQIIDLNGISQILWPDHCVQNTHGAEFHQDLKKNPITKIFPKGTDKTIDSYSGFFDNGRLKSTGLADYLKEKNINQVYICGLATDYCVKFTALDAVTEGFETYVINDACRGVNLNAHDSDKAIEEMKKAGCKIIESHDI